MGVQHDHPIFTLKIIPEGGKGTPADFTNDVLDFEYEDNENKADRLKITLDNHDLSKFDDPRLRKGNFIEVSWGYAGNMTQARQCMIEKISGGPNVFQIEALFKSVLMNKIKRSRVFNNVTRAQVVKRIAEENGYGEAVHDIEDTKIVHPHISQVGMTDAQFIKHLANREGFRFYVDATGFHFRTRKLKTKPIKTLVWYVDKTGEMMDWRMENDTKGRTGKVTLGGIDPKTGKVFKVEAKNDTVERTSLAATLEVIDEKTGQSTLQTRMAAEDIRPTGENSAAAAKRRADGDYLRSQHGNFKLNITIIGDPLMGAKNVVEVVGISKRLSGKYYVKKSTHKIGPGDYTTTIECVRAEHNGYNDNKKEAKSDGVLNEEKTSKENELREVEVVNSRTGETHREWKKK